MAERILQAVIGSVHKKTFNLRGTFSLPELCKTIMARVQDAGLFRGFDCTVACAEPVTLKNLHAIKR